MNFLGTVEGLPGVGPKTAATLEKYGIRTIKDMFYNLPRGYENYDAPTSISEMRPGKVVIRGQISDLSTRKARRRNLTVTDGIIRDQTGSIRVVWFNQGYREHQLQEGREYFFTGNFELKNGRYQLVSPSCAEVTEVDPRGGLSPIYVAHGALKSQDFRRIMDKSRGLFRQIPDLLPSMPKQYRAKALFYSHFPTTTRAIERARTYLAYEELFELILAAKLNKRENEKLRATEIPFYLDKIKDFLTKLPFTLTDAQKRAAWEIFQDMGKGRPMNRLLQGDVGSGKTMVAAMSAYGAFLGGQQVALLAPTAILATQHYETLARTLEPLGVRVGLLTGATKQKTELKYRLYNGELDLIVGTHALLTDDTEFKALGLVIIDEQHRFGVEQRRKLALKSPGGKAPHLLMMTATPIPRSLQLTVFGDLSVSALNQMPKGRQPIETRILREIDVREQLYPEIVEVIEAGHQAYWICKAIDDDPRTETTSVKTRATRLKQEFPRLKIEFLHGRMKPAEKDEVMGRFARGETQILVSTTVVEVGVDVPNATLMIVENAESYGLAQLHQLRGRVGRGEAASKCFLMTSADFNPSRRLKELERSNDGFHLAEVDLEMRGPGEIYGALQHGALDLRIATFSDLKMIRRARSDVEKFLQDPTNMVKWKELMAGITKYQQITTLN